ncbi:MAG TPA: TIGR03084 family metal-binding protein [Acidimicrobiales bacterium]|nr:TIGR03084 family metal-binding protein [Acidimicrobiales bacterium]
MSAVDGVRADLADEQAALDGVVAGLDAADWARPTPAAGWSVADQIGHLAYFDGTAAVALSDSDAFAASIADLVEGATAQGLDGFTLRAARALAPSDLLAAWRAARATLLAAAADRDDARRVPWYGPDMSAASFLGARLMETWAHGVDVTDALGAAPSATDRLAHVARLGAATRGWSYAVRGEAPPPGSVRVELVAPSGAAWSYGEASADDVVAGPALDFCLVVTQRRHVEDTALTCGELARDWLVRAQCFAGGPTLGPEPGGVRALG